MTPYLQDLSEDELALVSLLCLYAVDQKRCYVDYHAVFFFLEDWLVGENVETTKLPYNERYAPDICGNCGEEFRATVGGRIREYCPACAEVSIPFEARMLNYYNPPALEQCFELGVEQFQFYMSIAASLYRKGSWKRQAQAQKS